MTNTKLVNKLTSRVEVVKEIGRAIGVEANTIEDKLATYLKEIVVNQTDVKTSHTTEVQRCNWERYLAVILICAEDCSQSGGWLLQELKKITLMGKPTLPTTLSEALAMVNNYSALALMPQLMGGYEGS